MNQHHSDIEHYAQISYDINQIQPTLSMVVHCRQCGAKDIQRDHFNDRGFCKKKRG